MSLNLPSDGETGWGEKFRVALNTLLAMVSSKADSEHTHSGYAPINHNHDDEYSSIDHNHASIGVIEEDISDMSDRISEIKNTLDLLMPDLEGIEITSSISNRPGGLSISISTEPSIVVSSIMVAVMYNSYTVFSASSSSSFLYIPEAALGVPNGAQLHIKIMVFSGKSYRQAQYSHVFQHIDSDFETQVKNYMQTLTIQNIVNAFAQDTDALQSLANVLHSSNTLAHKIALLQSENQ